MKLFKKALLATAIFGAMGAQAADVSDAVDFTSVEGFAAAGAITDNGTVRVIVREKLEAGDKVTLQFGSAFKAIQNVTNGTAITLAQEVLINNGTADYTFTLDAAESDLANGKVVLELDTGYTVELDESFDVTVSADLFKATATESTATVTYSAARWQDGAPKDTTGDNVGTFLKFANQFGATVADQLDGRIERVSQATFVSGGVVAPVVNADADTFTIALTDKTNYLSAVLAAGTTATFEISGDFTDMVAGDVTFTTTGNIVATDVSVVSITDSLLTIAVEDDAAAAGGAAVNGNAGTITGTIDNGTRITAGETIKATDFTVDAEVDYGHTVNATILNSADLGDWAIDATIINIPYFPVGFEGLDTSVHFANESNKDVDVIVTAIDDSGKEYGPFDMADLAADTVTKVKQDDVMSLLGLTAKTKLSITFNIDANDGDVNAYAFSNAGTARQSLVTSQQKGK